MRSTPPGGRGMPAAASIPGTTARDSDGGSVSPRRWRRRRDVRTRLVALTLVALAITMVVIELQTGLVLHQALRSSAEARVTEVAQQVAQEVAAEGPEAARRVSAPVRVLDAQGGTVVAHPSETLAPSPPAGLSDAAQVTIVGAQRFPSLFTTPEPMIAVLDTEHAGDAYRVVTSTRQTSQQAAVRALLVNSALTMPFLLVLAGLATLYLVGRALRPVDQMRDAAERIDALQLSERLPEGGQDTELDRLAHTLNEMLGRVQASRQARDRFVADAGHELRSPLTNLRASVQLGRSAGTAERWNELAPVMEQEGLRLQHLVDDLFLLARMDESGVEGAAREDVDLDDIAWSETTRLRAAGAVRVGGSIAPARVSGDSRALARVIRNLVENAVRAASSQVDISVTREGSMSVLRVEDDGSGVAETDRERVFERFVRLDEARQRDAGGSGLGLAIVSDTVRAHGGTIRVDASPTLGGARFEVRIPAQE